MQTPTDAPTISVVIPCRNERRHIEACVKSMLAQEQPPGGFEVVVADGMSDDGTREILERLRKADHRLIVVDNPAQITPCAMNAGISISRGRYIAIAGAHNRYAPDYLRQSVAVLEETGVDNVGGAMICEAETRVQRAIAAAHHSRFAAGGARWHDPDYEGPADTVFGGVYRREVFDAVGLFDPELVRNQDDELNLRLSRSQGRIWQSPRIRSWYSPRTSLRALFRQYFQYGYWKVRVIQKHRLPASPRHLAPGSFALSLLTFGAAAMFSPAAGAALLALVSAYAIASIAASVAAAAKRGRGILPLMPAVFACYHFGYGLGFLTGVADFLVLRRRPGAMARGLTRHG